MSWFPEDAFGLKRLVVKAIPASGAMERPAWGHIIIENVCAVVVLPNLSGWYSSLAGAKKHNNPLCSFLTSVSTPLDTWQRNVTTG